MYRFSLLLGLVLLLFPCYTPQPALAQADVAVLTGRVVDAETGAPLPGAHVFIAASMIGTTTDADGRYRLTRVPLGAHRLFVSMVGFAAAREDLFITDAGPHGVDVRLQAEVVEVGRITVTAERDRRWRRRLRRFERLFLGESDNARATRLLNPEVLDFDARWWGKLVATASAPLVIENRALGYRIRYFLKEFEAAGGSIRYDGEPLFEELTPATPDEAARWVANRRRAYEGSFRHFLLALLAGQVEAAGFLAYSRPSREHLGREAWRFRLRPERILEEGPADGQHTLRFPGFVEVVYTREPVEDGFAAWLGRSAGATRQWSYIELTDGPAAVDDEGTVVDPYGVTVYGYFAYERVADELPKEYRPD